MSGAACKKLMIDLRKPLLVLLCIVAAAGAQASPTGQIKSSTDVYPMRVSKATDDVVPYLNLEIADKYKLSKRLRLQFKGIAWVNPEAKGTPENHYADLPEAFAEWKATSDFKLRLGMNTLNWGVVDIFSPSDMANPVVLFTPTRVIKRGTPMLEAQWDNSTFGFHAFYSPWQQSPLLPSMDSRWLPRKLLLNVQFGSTRILIPNNLEYTREQTTNLNNALNHNAGLKFSAHLGGMDMQLAHIEGVAPSPKVRPTITLAGSATGRDLEAQSPIGLGIVNYRVRTSSMGLTWAREKWIYRFESAYQHTISNNDLLQPWSWANVFAIETNMDVGTSTITWLAQFYYTQNPQSPDNLISSNYRLFERTGIVGGRWAYSDTLTLTASILYETRQQGAFASVGFEQKLSDSLKWGLSYRDFSAAQDGLLKTYDRNDHASMDLLYYF